MRILIVDDHEIVRRGIREVLQAQPGWQICGEAKNGREAIALADQSRPDVVVMDLSMPELNGLEAVRRIRRANPRTEIVILSLHLADQLAFEIIRAGARGYILKSDADRDLVTAIQAVSSGKTFFTTRVSEMMVNGFTGKDGGTAGSEGDATKRLTSRQREIVQLIAEGRSSKEVAVALNLSVKTAETHRANIMRRLQLHSVSELVRYAVRNLMVWE
jgi:DNA-binding NarL/FixJ family response regulator